VKVIKEKQVKNKEYIQYLKQEGDERYEIMKSVIGKLL